MTWKWKDPPDGKLQLGLIAQEVDAVMPELVLRESDPAKPLGLNYIGLVPVAIKAIQEQQAQIENQQAQIRERERQASIQQQQTEQYRKQLAVERRRNQQQQSQLANQQTEIEMLKRLVCATHTKAALCKALRRTR